MVEYEDEFGRIRTARKSEVPRNLVKRDDDVPPEPEFKCVCPSLQIGHTLSHLSRLNLSYSPHVICESHLVALNCIPTLSLTDTITHRRRPRALPRL